MKLGVLFSGGKDSTYAAYIAKKEGYEISCLITMISENLNSYMFHTPSVSKVEKQAEVIGIPLIKIQTCGEKEKELGDLEKAIKKAIKDYDIEGIVTGAVESVYQASRIQKICYKLKIECFNPLWQKDQFELLRSLIKNRFEIIIVGVFAYPLDKTWLGMDVDDSFIKEVRKLQKKYKINPAGEGGEFESFVVNCPLFSKRLKIVDKQIKGSGNSWRMEVEIE